MKQLEIRKFILLIISYAVTVLGNLTDETNSISKELGPTDFAKTFGFRCVGRTGIQTAIRINEMNDIECFSLNGKDCLFGLNTDKKCEEAVNKTTIGTNKPLSCGVMYQALHGSTGYDSDGSWCDKGLKWFFGRWHCPSETGLKIAIKESKETGEIMCLSKDFATCYEAKDTEEVCRKANKCKGAKKIEIKKTTFLEHSVEEELSSFVEIKTTLDAQNSASTSTSTDTSCSEAPAAISEIGCNSLIKEELGYPGYQDPGKHWCKYGLAYFRYSGLWILPNVSKQNKAIRLGKLGDIECASKNSNECYINKGGNSKVLEALNTFLSNNGKDEVKVFSCGKNEAPGKTGFEDLKGWCYKAKFSVFNEPLPEGLDMLDDDMGPKKNNTKPANATKKNVTPKVEKAKPKPRKNDTKPKPKVDEDDEADILWRETMFGPKKDGFNAVNPSDQWRGIDLDDKPKVDDKPAEHEDRKRGEGWRNRDASFVKPDQKSEEKPKMGDTWRHGGYIRKPPGKDGKNGKDGKDADGDGKDADGKDADGKDADGKDKKDKDEGKERPIINKKDGKPILDKNGKPVIGVSGGDGKPIIGKDGKPVIGADGKPVVDGTLVTPKPLLDKDDKPVIGKDGKPIEGIAGGDGKPVITIDGKPAVDKNGKPVVDGTLTKPKVLVDASGKNIKDKNGKDIEAITGGDGKPILGKDGKPVIGKDGKPVAGILADANKPKGRKGKEEKKLKPVVDKDGKPVLDKDGKPAFGIRGGQGQPIIGKDLKPINDKDGKPIQGTLIEPEKDKDGKGDAGKDGKGDADKSGKGDADKSDKGGEKDEDGKTKPKIKLAAEDIEAKGDTDGNAITKIKDGKDKKKDKDGKDKDGKDKKEDKDGKDKDGKDKKKDKDDDDDDDKKKEADKKKDPFSWRDEEYSDDNGPDGKPKKDRNQPKAVIGKDGKPILDKNGKPIIAIRGGDGKPVIGKDGKEVKGKDGKPIVDAKLVKPKVILDSDGEPVKGKDGKLIIAIGGGDGKPVIGSDGKPVKDKDGKPLAGRLAEPVKQDPKDDDKKKDKDGKSKDGKDKDGKGKKGKDIKKRNKDDKTNAETWRGVSDVYEDKKPDAQPNKPNIKKIAMSAKGDLPGAKNKTNKNPKHDHNKSKHDHNKSKHDHNKSKQSKNHNKTKPNKTSAKPKARKPTPNPMAAHADVEQMWRNTEEPYDKNKPVVKPAAKKAEPKKPVVKPENKDTWRTETTPYNKPKPPAKAKARAAAPEPKPGQAKPQPLEHWRDGDQPTSKPPSMVPKVDAAPVNGWTGKFTALMRPMTFYSDKAVKIGKGTKIKLAHVLTRMVLHSHNLNYNTGSRKQEITGFWSRDDGDWWIVESAGATIKSGESIKLKHMLTGKYLNSENQRSPTSGQQEVNGTGNGGNIDWAVIIDNSYVKGDLFWKSGDVIRLAHRSDGKFLHSHNLRTKVTRQQEVTCYDKMDNNNYWSVIERK